MLLLAVAASAQSDWIYTTNGGAITIQGYRGPGGDIVIPAVINGLPVRTFGFEGCMFRTDVTSVVIPASVTSIGHGAFEGCTGLKSLYFQGNAPGYGIYAFPMATNVTFYCLPGATGWDSDFGRPAVPWLNPAILEGSLALESNGFGFRVSWATDRTVVVEATRDLSRPVWSPVSTNTLGKGWSDFRDPESADFSSRFYRVRPQ